MVKLGNTLGCRLPVKFQHRLEALVRLESGDELHIHTLFQLLTLARQAAPGARSHTGQHALISARERQLVLYLPPKNPFKVTCRANDLSTAISGIFHGDAAPMAPPLFQKRLG